MEWNRTIRWLRWVLPCVAIAVPIVGVYFFHSERFELLVVLTIVISMVGLIFDFWVRSSPGKPIPLIDPRKHALALKVLFFGAVTGGIIAISHDFLDPSRTWRRKVFSILIPLTLLFSYNLLIAFTRHLRTRRQNSMDA
jgi:hypothetical protein